MIAWIEGKVIDSWSINSRQGLIISCSGIGYEVQLLTRDLNNYSGKEQIALWIHQVYRDDGISMFGFKERADKDLFKKLIEVNGIGPQIAILLLDKYEYTELIEAIKREDINKLTKISGIGKRIAERLTLELRDKLFLANLDQSRVLDVKESYIKNPIVKDLVQEEIINVLTELEYEDTEIKHAIQAVDRNLDLENKSLITGASLKKDEVIEKYLKQALVWLNQEVSSKGA